VLALILPHFWLKTAFIPLKPKIFVKRNLMRTVLQPQLKLGETDIAAIILDPKSRDDIPQLLRGLQYIYTEASLRERVFAILEEVMPERSGAKGKASAKTGRPGMEQWKILVLGVLRLSLNADYDRIQELANQHKTIRQMLGHSDWLDEHRYELQTIRDNVSLFTPEILDRINQEVVHAGHQALKKNAEETLKARADSFVVKTDVHFPTDINLLWDAIRKTLHICAGLCATQGLTEWRQSAYHLRCFKKSYRAIQKLKHSTSQDEAKRQAKQDQINAAYQTTIDQAEVTVQRARATGQRLHREHGVPTALLADLETYLAHADRQIDQIRRRVLQGEKIPHAEKVFSLFQPHTEWISKGKAGVPVELGLRVAIVEDQHRFILHHHVMEKTTDDQIAVILVEQAQARFPALQAISLDKGFHSPGNQTQLKQRLEKVILPKKGRLSEADKAHEFAPEFVRLRRQHAAVESAINALGVHGLDQCPDQGIDGFKRYVALAIVARNIQRLGAVLRAQEQQEADRRRGPYKKAA
jgi:hypothetical protein